MDVIKLLPVSEVVDHLHALALVWIVAGIAGRALSPLLPDRLQRNEGWIAAPALGVAYWTCALFLFPFRGGLIVAAGLVILGLLAAQLRSPAAFGAAWSSLEGCKSRRCSRAVYRACGLLGVGCAAYLTPLFTQHVPPGMDASMHAANARFIALKAGLPDDYAPMAAELPFAPVNLGVPTLTAMAVRLGASPLAGTLAAAHLTYSCLILSLYLLLRLAASPMTAAVIAVGTVWAARSPQATFSWGGFPTVMGVAVGLIAARLLVELVRGRRLTPAILLAECVASLPMVHGVTAAAWLYVVAPLAGTAALLVCRRRIASAVKLLLAAGLATGLLGSYLAVGRPAMSADVRDIIRQWQQDYAPKGHGLQLIANLSRYMARSTDDALAAAGLLAVAILVVRRRWRATAIVLAGAALLGIVLLNARYWLLPASFLLYPERVVYWMVPLIALAFALAWRSLPSNLRQRRFGVAISLVVMLVALARHQHYFQRKAVRPAISDGAWQALHWAAGRLDPAHAFVLGDYGSAAAYLPALAGIATSAAHVHFVQVAAKDNLCRTRPFTHCMCTLERHAGVDRPSIALPAGAVFEWGCGRVQVWRLPATAHWKKGHL